MNLLLLSSDFGGFYYFSVWGTSLGLTPSPAELVPFGCVGSVGSALGVEARGHVRPWDQREDLKLTRGRVAFRGLAPSFAWFFRFFWGVAPSFAWRFRFFLGWLAAFQGSQEEH